MPLQVQSVVFPRNVFTKKKAITWITKNGYVYKKLDITPTQYRFRQRPPVTGSLTSGHYISKRLPNGVILVLVNVR